MQAYHRVFSMQCGGHAAACDYSDRWAIKRRRQATGLALRLRLPLARRNFPRLMDGLVVFCTQARAVRGVTRGPDYEHPLLGQGRRLKCPAGRWRLSGDCGRIYTQPCAGDRCGYISGERWRCEDHDAPSDKYASCPAAALSGQRISISRSAWQISSRRVRELASSPLRAET